MYLTLLLSTITATTAMTLLSYAFSATFRELYKEPLLLKYLLQRFGSKLTANTEEVLGWVIHYIVGFLFVLCFHLLLEFDLITLSFLSGVLFGAAAGILGIVWWHLMFKLSDFPKIDFKGYYWQLFFVHVVFGVVVVSTYKLFP